jgi:serine/threonine-protein kinase
MVMEFVRGESLDKLSERLGALSPERAAYIIEQILSALEHAHRAGVVHRDVKPANVMVTDEGAVKIMDFGIARVLGAEQKTVDFRLMGTPAYMSPEQVLGEEVDGRSDLYSVGVLFYRLISGALPFAADTALGMLQRQIRDTPIPLCAHRGGLPDWCESIVQRALAKTQGERFQSAEEFREALSRATGPLPVTDLAKTFAIGGREAVVPAPAITETLDLSRERQAVSPAPPVVIDRPASPPAKRSNLWAHAAAAAIAIGIVVVPYVMSDRDATQAVIEPTAQAVAQTPPAPVTEPAQLAQPVETVPARAEQLADVQATAVAAPSRTEVAPVVAAPSAPPRRVASSTPVVVSPPAPAEPVAPAETPEPPPVERRVTRPAADSDPILVFETRALVGTRKSKEQGAQLLMGDGKITIIPTSNPAEPLCSFPYGRVLAISVSRGRDPLWNSPQGPAPVARAGGTLSKIGIQVSRDWIALRTSTEEQFVSMRFDEVLLKRVLLALEERTGHRPLLLELPKEKD